MPLPLRVLPRRLRMERWLFRAALRWCLWWLRFQLLRTLVVLSPRCSRLRCCCQRRVRTTGSKSLRREQSKPQRLYRAPLNLARPPTYRYTARTKSPSPPLWYASPHRLSPISSSFSRKLNPGESFPIEWRVGHPGRRTFFTIVRAEDEQMLRTATKSVLDDYLNLAPEAAFAISGATTSPGVTCGRSRAATCSACSVGQCGGECKLITGVCSRDPDEVYAIANPLWSDGNYFLEEKYDKKFVSTCGSNCARKQACGDDEGPVRGTMLSKTDGRNIKRPEPYNCDDGASSPTRHRSSTTIGHGCRECEIDQWVYFDEKLKRDTRAAYNSSKYPWIVSVQGYFISSPGAFVCVRVCVCAPTAHVQQSHLTFRFHLVFSPLHHCRPPRRRL